MLRLDAGERVGSFDNEGNLLFPRGQTADQLPFYDVQVVVLRVEADNRSAPEVLFYFPLETDKSCPRAVRTGETETRVSERTLLARSLVKSHVQTVEDPAPLRLVDFATPPRNFYNVFDEPVDAAVRVAVGYEAYRVGKTVNV